MIWEQITLIHNEKAIVLTPPPPLLYVAIFSWKKKMQIDVNSANWQYINALLTMIWFLMFKIVFVSECNWARICYVHICTTHIGWKKQSDVFIWNVLDLEEKRKTNIFLRYWSWFFFFAQRTSNQGQGSGTCCRLKDNEGWICEEGREEVG